jgi:hypothetical protein
MSFRIQVTRGHDGAGIAVDSIPRQEVAGIRRSELSQKPFPAPASFSERT